MDKELQLLSFEEDKFDLAAHKKMANAHAKAVTHAVRVRRQVSVAKIILVIMLFVAGFCLYYLVTDVISRYQYNKHQASSALTAVYLIK